MEQNNQDLATIIINAGNKDKVDAERSEALPPVTPSDFGGSEVSRTSFYGDAMNDDNVNDLVGDIVPSVIVLIGFPEYGKSTFVSSLYHLVMVNGKIGKYEFVDSDTLAGFERRSHVRNVEVASSKRLDRTPLYADYLLSMLFRNTESGEFLKLVLSDRSGEIYRKYSDKEEIFAKDKLLPYANHLVFLIDSEKLIDDNYNVEMNDDLEYLITRMNSKSMFCEGKKIDLICNKIDKINGDKEKLATFNSKITEIEALFPKDCTIQKKEKLSAINPITNKDLQKFFIYLLDTCDCSAIADKQLVAQIDWARNGWC